MSAPASKPIPGEVAGWSIDPGNVELIHLDFQRLDFQPDAGSEDKDPVGVEFEFTPVRIAANMLAVALEVKVHSPAVIDLAVTAGTVLTVEHPDEPDEVVDRELAKIAAQVGPVIIYPYVRELVADLTRRTGRGTLTLPIYQVGALFEVKPEEIRLPAAEEAPKKKRTRTPKKPAKKAATSTSKKP